MPLIQRNEVSSHWYRPDGSACHEVIGKSTGLPRPTTVTDARKLGLYPSVTNIIGIKAKPGLDVWKQDNAILAALATPRIEGEEEEQWHLRIVEESQRIGKEASEWGTLLHEQIEVFCLEGAFPGTGEILDYVAPYAAWHRENVAEVIWAERSVVGNGYAGRLDLYAMVHHEGRVRRAVIDFKSQKLKGKPKGSFYKEWHIQLAAYAAAITEPGEEWPLLISLIIPADTPGPVQPKIWDDNESALAAFRACQELWGFEKDYWPQKGGAQ
jgi:hypothetical protein